MLCQGVRSYHLSENRIFFRVVEALLLSCAASCLKQTESSESRVFKCGIVSPPDMQEIRNTLPWILFASMP
jgi:hypothetical protein